MSSREENEVGFLWLVAMAMVVCGGVLQILIIEPWKFPPAAFFASVVGAVFGTVITCWLILVVRAIGLLVVGVLRDLLEAVWGLVWSSRSAQAKMAVAVVMACVTVFSLMLVSGPVWSGAIADVLR